MYQLQLLKGDITSLQVDAIVNAANSTLLGGGGVDGAIHRKAGIGLLEECKNLDGCATGEAKITSGYNLLAKFVIHTVGPVWRGGGFQEEALLQSCYYNSLRLAEKFKLKSIAFPNISTGIYGFPKDRAAIIAIETVKEAAMSFTQIEQVIFVAFDEENYDIYQKLLT
ncbi:MAG: O-acetyl-ADP-ribose deacetylase [Bacteroidota bacterium]|nr:MAG: O-acetyl-ADP-ribose deacetylase [Bacteroidota bacterium]